MYLFHFMRLLMKEITILEGNYYKLLEICSGILGGIKPENLEAKEIIKQLHKDFSRTPFVDLNNKPYSQYQASWLKNPDELAPKVSCDYMQGNMSGSLFTELLFKHLCDLSDNLDFLEAKKTLSFSYLDDQDSPCGFTLTFDPTDAMWVAAIIRNAHQDPESRKVLILSSHDVKNFPYEKMIKADTLSERIAAQVGSTSIALLMEALFNENGTVANATCIELAKKLKLTDNNSGIVGHYLKLTKPLELNSTQLMLATLQDLLTQGFNLTEHFFQVQAVKNHEQSPLYQYWTAHKKDCKLVIFAPSKDVDVIYKMSGDMVNKPYFLDTQVIAKTLVEEGYTCFIPVAEYDSVQILHQPGITACKNFVSKFNFFAKSEKEEIQEKGMLARMHWVTLIWNKEQLKFFDPKSSQSYVAKYDNSKFKQFAQQAGYEVEEKSYLQTQKYNSTNGYYGAVKEKHPQGTLDIHNCGYYIIFRMVAAMREIERGEKINECVFPEDLREIQKYITKNIALGIGNFDLTSYAQELKKIIIAENKEFFSTRKEILPLEEAECCDDEQDDGFTMITGTKQVARKDKRFFRIEDIDEDKLRLTIQDHIKAIGDYELEEVDDELNSSSKLGYN